MQLIAKWLDNSRFTYKVTDLDSGAEIRHCIAADDGLGEYAVYKTNPDGTLYQTQDGDLVIVKCRGNIKITIEEK